MALKIEQTGAERGKLNIMIYGKPGTGKTRFIGSTYPKFKVLIASAESGLLSLNNILDDKGVPVKFDHVKITQFEELEELYKFIRFEKHDYDCLAMDSGTEIQNVCMEAILRKEGIEKARIQDWGTLGDKMARMIRSMRDLDINFIMTALEEESKDETTGEMRVLPMFKGKFQQLIAGYFDECFYSYIETKKGEDGKAVQKHKLLTRATSKSIGKDRSGKLDPIIDPDFISIYNAIYGGSK